MPSFEETLARMKGLYTYGKEINESNNVSTHTLEHHSIAANGNAYGIIRECNKYYIKTAPADKEFVAEAYEYIGGFNNKKDYEYTSFANAQKQFELKMASINEACDANVNISTLDPFKKGEFIVEGTEKMKNEIARQRQIMYNAAMLMNEATEIGASRKDDTVMFDGKNPEAETGKKGDEGGKAATAKPEFAGSKTNGVDKKVAPFNNNASDCADQLKEECEDGKCDWGSEGIGKGRDPKQVGWEMDGQQTVNEEEDDWASKGLPSTPGVGEAKPEAPFDKAVNEGEDFADEGDAEGDDAEGDGTEGDDFNEDDFEADDFGGEDDDMATDTDLDDGVEDVDMGMDGEDGDDLGGDAEGDMDTDIEDDDLGGDAEGDMEGDDFGGEAEGDGDIMSQIQALQSQIDALKAQINGGEDGDMEGDDFSGDAEGDMDADIEGDDLGGEAEGGMDADMDGDDLGGDAEGDMDDDMNGDDLGGDAEGDDFGGDAEGDMEGDDFGGEAEGDDSFDDDMDECGDGTCVGDFPMMEAKQSKMNAIIESVVKRILKEDELHDFGKHPGYRKKPMELPSTGEDKNQWGEDWNDESVHGEEPFGSKIGNGDPFNKLVDAITKDVMYQLKAGIPIEGKKKAE